MSTPASWLNDLALLPDLDPQQWQPMNHQHDSQRLSDAQLAPVLAALGPVSGWLCEPATITELRQQPVVLKQHPLAAELFAQAGDDPQPIRCWQLSHHGRDQWQLDSHSLQPCDAEQANCLGEHARHRHARRASAHLGYWRLWQADADGAPHCAIALLHAIDEVGQ